MSTQANFVIVEGATLPVLKAQLIDDITKVPIADITGATVTFPLTNAAGETINPPVVITSGPEARVEVQWASGDTDKPGDFRGRFSVVYPDTSVLLIPNTEAKYLVRIVCD